MDCIALGRNVPIALSSLIKSKFCLNLSPNVLIFFTNSKKHFFRAARPLIYVHAQTYILLGTRDEGEEGRSVSVFFRAKKRTNTNDETDNKKTGQNFFFVILLLLSSLLFLIFVLLEC